MVLDALVKHGAVMDRVAPQMQAWAVSRRRFAVSQLEKSFFESAPCVSHEPVGSFAFLNPV
jgi:hypothetical protein